MYQRPLRPTDLGIIMSYQCQCACKHCLYNCGPRWKDWMSPEILREALQATQAWHHHFQIHLTGGEPFLNFPLLLEGVRIATELDIPCYVETNAGWCLREEDVAEKFAALREAGLNAVLISCSPSRPNLPGHSQGTGDVRQTKGDSVHGSLPGAGSALRFGQDHTH